jgi:hypothetical protein
MAARPSKKARTDAEMRAAYFGAFNKLCLTWMIGIIIGVLGLKPTSINAAGLALSIERPEIIQGLIFLVCLWETYELFFVIWVRRAFVGRDGIRQAIWLMLPKGRRSFVGTTLADRKNLKMKVRTTLRMQIAAISIVAATPALLILIFNRAAVLAAIQAILGIRS